MESDDEENTQDFVRKTSSNYKTQSNKFKILSLKPKNTNCKKVDENKQNKRQNEEPTFKTPYNNKKKKKIEDKVHNNINGSNELSLFGHDTLDGISITQVLLKESGNIPTPSTNNNQSNIISKPISNNSGFDAFQSYFKQLEDASTSKKPSEKEDPQKDVNISVILKLNEDKKLDQCSQNDFSQLFKDSQVLNQLEAVIQENSVEEEAIATCSNYIPPPKPTIFKVPQVTQSRNKLIKSQKEKSLSLENSFINETFTSQFRKEIDTLFEQIETSICLMGTEGEIFQTQIPDDVFDMIMQEHATITKDKTLQQIQQLNESEFNASFGTIIKQALLSNATKTVTVSNSVNLTSKAIPEFREQGPFYGLPLKVKELIKQYKNIDKVYDWQDECLKLEAIKNRKNLIYALPTSGGKTLVAEILILREIICFKRNALFILPYVSIVQEKVWSLSPFAVALDFLVEEYAANKGTYPPRKRRRKNSVYIATIEKALGLINSLIETDRLTEIGLIVVDELHLIGELGRGATLEALLTKLMYLKSNIQIVGMSATIGNLNDIKEFLKSEVYTKNFRPVELSEYVKCGKEIAKINYNCTEEFLTVVRKVDFDYSDAVSKVDPDRLGGLVTEVIPEGSCLIFCSSKKNCENVTYLLCKVLSTSLKEYKKQDKQHLKEALKDESGRLCDVFDVSIDFGIAYHHSGLTSDERKIIEDGFRSGIISVICCTSTLAAGVNLPAKRVILRQPYVGREFINLSKYKQMVGRAGRAGFDEVGDSILICTELDLPKVKELLKAPMDQALSNMHSYELKGLRHLLLSCISLGIANTKSELEAVSNTTLLFVQKNKLDVNIKKLTRQVICDLFKLKALEKSSIKKVIVDADVSIKFNDTNTSFDSTISDDSPAKVCLSIRSDTKIVVSALGDAAIKGGLDLARAHMLREDLHQAQKSLVLLDDLHLLYLVTPYDVVEQIKPNMQTYYFVYTRLGPKELLTAKILGITESVSIKMLRNQPIKNVPERVIIRFYLALMLYDLWKEIPVFEVSQKFQIARGVVQNLMTSAASFASNVVNFCAQFQELWAFQHLLKGMSQRISHCAIKELVPLMELPAVKQSRAKQLYNAGYKTLQSIAKASSRDLVENIEFMSVRVANQLIAAAKMLLLEKVENLREEAEDVLNGEDISNQPNTTMKY